MNKENIKSILESGGSLHFGYKNVNNPKSWVGNAKIYSVSPLGGMTPKIVVEFPDFFEQFKMEDIDIAINIYIQKICSKDNWMWKQKESINQLYNEGHTLIDLDISTDRKLVEDRRIKILENEY